MRKRCSVRVVALLGLCAVMAAACGGNEETPVNTATGTAAGAVAWTRVLSGEGEQAGWQISTTKAGQIVMVGTMQGRVDFGAAGKIDSVSDNDIFIAWLDRDGKVARVRRFGETGGHVPTGIAVDSSGGVVISGVMMGAIDFGGGPIDSKGGPDAFLAAFNANGDYRFALQAGNPDAQTGGQVAIDDDGNIIWSGTFEGQIDIGAVSLTSAGETDAFVTKVSPSGVTVWARAIGGAKFDGEMSMALLPQGQVLVSGFYEGAPDLGGGALPDTATADGHMLVALGADGSFAWSRGAANSAGFFAYSVQVDETGSPWLVGPCAGDVDLFGTKISAGQGQGVALAKLDATGKPLLTQVFVAEEPGNIQATRARNGGMVIAGHFGKKMQVGGQTLTSVGDDDLFFVWVDSVGRVTRHERAGGAGRERLGDVSMLPTGQVVATGLFEGSMNVGGGTHTSIGGPDGFTIMLN